MKDTRVKGDKESCVEKVDLRRIEVLRFPSGVGDKESKFIVEGKTYWYIPTQEMGKTPFDKVKTLP